MPSWQTIPTHAVLDELPVGDWNDVATDLNLLGNSNGGFPASMLNVSSGSVAATNPGANGKYFMIAGRYTGSLGSLNNVAEGLGFPNGVLSVSVTACDAATAVMDWYVDPGTTDKTLLSIIFTAAAAHVDIAYVAIGF